MSVRNLLTGRKFCVKNKCELTTHCDIISYFINRYKSVVNVEFCDTKNNNGDWSGLIMQDNNERYGYAVPFTIKNKHQEDGFDVYTDRDFIIVESLSVLKNKKQYGCYDTKFINKIWKDCCCGKNKIIYDFENYPYDKHDKNKKKV